MKRALKWIAIGLGSLAIIIGIITVVLYSVGRSRLNRTYDVDVALVPINDDPETQARGEHLVTAIAACAECHGEGLGGEAFINDPALGTVVSANLTRGEGGIGDMYSDEDWIRAIRHGVDPQGKPLLVMPAQHFQNMSAADLGATIVYLKSAPAVDNVPPETELTPLAYILVALGQLDDLIPADFVDHDAPLSEAVPQGPNQAYGEYLVSIATCRDCHGTELAGGQAGPGEPIGPNLTPAGELSEWTQADFFQLIRNGQTPASRQIVDFMPWRHYRQMSDAELEAIWLYLQSLEPVKTPSGLGSEG